MDTDYLRGGNQKAVYSKGEVYTWNCPLCGEESADLIKVERGILGIVYCKNCSLIRVNPRLKAPEKIYWGKKENYIEELRLLRSGARHHRDRNYLADLKYLQNIKPTGNFLDIGTNVGTFLRLARNRGWTLQGVEPSPILSELAVEWWGLNIINNFVESADLPKSHYDIVTMTDVFEHIVNPQEVLVRIRELLKPDGILFLKVPNAHFNMFKFNVRSKILKNNNSDDFDSYEHVCHYTDKTLKMMLEKSGYKIKKMYIDLPIQLPAWHNYVGRYYGYSSPFWMDWKRHLGRETLYWASQFEKILTRKIGHFAGNIACIAEPR